MKLSLVFDACALLAVLVLCGAVATAGPPADPEADRVRELHKELAGTRALPPAAKPITFNTVPGPSAIVWAEPCRNGNNEYSFTVNDGDGKPIVSINECTGKVTVAHPERMDQQALEFWRTVQRAWPNVCARPAIAK